MTSRALNFWNTHALPNYFEHCKYRADIRLAMNAALSAFHMADYVFAEYRISDPSKLSGYINKSDYRTKVLCAACSEFELLQDVANAHKHLWLGPNPTPTQFTRSSTQAYSDGSVIFVDDVHSNPVDFGQALDKVVTMWKGQIAQRGL